MVVAQHETQWRGRARYTEFCAGRKSTPSFHWARPLARVGRDRVERRLDRERLPTLRRRLKEALAERRRAPESTAEKLSVPSGATFAARLPCVADVAPATAAPG